MSLALSLVLLLSGADTEKSAEHYFRAGARAYEAGQYLVSARALEEAYRLSPLPEVAFSLAQACRLQFFVDDDMRWLTRAAELYREYIRAMNTGNRRADAVSFLAEIMPVLERRANEQRARAAVPAPTQLLVTSPTEGAKASLDGGALTALPLVLDVAPGPHEVKISGTGYRADTQKVLAVEGRLITVEAELEPEPGRVDLAKFAADASVTVDGRVVGVTPLAGPLELAPGRHEIVLSQSGYVARKEILDIARAQSSSLEGQLERTNLRVASYWVLGASLVALSGSAVFLGLTAEADGRASEIFDAPRPITVSEADSYDRALADRDSRTATAVTFAGTALALAGIGLALRWLD